MAWPEAPGVAHRVAPLDHATYAWPPALSAVAAFVVVGVLAYEAVLIVRIARFGSSRQLARLFWVYLLAHWFLSVGPAAFVVVDAWHQVTQRDPAVSGFTDAFVFLWVLPFALAMGLAGLVWAALAVRPSRPERHDGNLARGVAASAGAAFAVFIAVGWGIADFRFEASALPSLVGGGVIFASFAATAWVLHHQTGRSPPPAEAPELLLFLRFAAWPTLLILLALVVSLPVGFGTAPSDAVQAATNSVIVPILLFLFALLPPSAATAMLRRPTLGAPVRRRSREVDEAGP